MGGLFSRAPSVNTIHYAEKPVEFRVKKDGSDQDKWETTSIRAFIESRCPSLLAGFKPIWWGWTGHAQTAYCVAGDFSQVDKVVYDRKLLRLKDGGTIGLDFTPPVDERTLPEDTPTVVVLHGLTGGSHESYVRAILAPACTPVSDRGLGYRAVVINFRGCAGTPLTSPQLYSAAHTDDLRQALLYIAHLYPNAPLMGIGFSLGANVLTRYLAEEAQDSRLNSGCILACPWNLLANSRKLEGTWFYRTVYSRAMGGNLARLFLSHAEELAQFPDHPLTKTLPIISARQNALCITDFDGTVTRLGGGSTPPFPFATADDYYTYASSHDKLRYVRVPCLAVNSSDDPVVHEIPIENSRHNGWVAMAVTKYGGHLGWFAEGAHGPKRWISQPVLEWLGAVGSLLERKPPKRQVITQEDGWLVEQGREHLGCKPVEGGDKIVGVEGEGGLLQGL
ncbi:AB-hydrolase YheT [Punctularia strigosozonata HHB-11173 SS5]|uniref:AB-hydrolase YheT n=1 Tax=Punctularia strigosozonata (strain HHB-11173) TaxID=741275 RepID=UPI000441714C|nr:AB-hydrolase YheT [Punctularia strigosozonata HHB-11173 SS5]EIN07419.1 AB-hydrolase YheT [Punctularia strigosozonata HHB-11173 SS5]